MKHYKIEKEKGRLWLIEDAYSPLFEEKTEAIFAQCNGYMGVRAAHPFLSIEEKRGCSYAALLTKRMTMKRPNW